MTTEYRLHCFAQSGNAYRAALALNLLGADWEPVFVDFFNGATRTPEYRALNEMGEAPVLEHGDVKLSQSAVILDYLAEKFGRFGPRDNDERREILRWTIWDNQKLNGMLGPARFVRNLVPPENRNPDVVAFLLGRGRNSLSILDAHLKNRDWIVGDHMTIADISCTGYLHVLDEVEIDVAEYPEITRWLGTIAALPGWGHPYDLMPGHPLPGR